MSEFYTETFPATFLQNLSQNANTHYSLPPIHCGRTIQFDKIMFLHPHPISRSLDSNLHEFEFISTSIAHIFMLFGGLFLPFWPFCMGAHYACSPKYYR